MKSCPKCYQTQEDGVEVCDCGHLLIASKSETAMAGNGHSGRLRHSLQIKYPSLKIVSGYFGLTAWLNLSLSLFISALLSWWAISEKSLVAIPGIFICLLFGFVSFVWLKSFGELICVLIDIEENQRVMIAQSERADRA